MFPITTIDATVLQKCSECDAEKNLCICLSCNLLFCDHIEEDHIFSHFISTQHAYGMNLKEKKIFNLSLDKYDNDFIQKNNCTQLVEYPFDDFISNMITDYNDPLITDNGSERIVEKEKLMNIDLIKNLEDLRNENKSLSTTIDGLTQEKEKQDKQLNEIHQNLVNERATNKQLEKRFNKNLEDLGNENKYLSTTIDGLTQEKENQDKQLNEIQQNLVNERAMNKQLEKRFNKNLEELRNENKNLSITIDSLTQEKEKQDKQLNEIQQNLVNERATNKQLEKRLNKSQQELNKLKHDFNEEKIINQQLIQKQNDLTDKMANQNKEIKTLNDQVSDLILHLVIRSKFMPHGTRKL
ncbi:unnamed protein product [Rotaria sp. Silwood1]|nr:unnamed protein product [Rotaria sp. Silwood1]CAF4942665.1 unnamed protein product [Rotaria sp. Silwood1]